jgi:hypothetical protein
VSIYLNSIYSTFGKGALAFLIVLTALCCSSASVVAQNASKEKEAIRKMLVADLDTLHAVILRTHPNPFAFSSKSAFDLAFEEGKKAIDSTFRISDFARLTSTILNTMRDSHTSIDYAGLINQHFETSGLFLPLDVIWIDDKIYVENDYDSVITRGSQLVSVNTFDAMELYAKALDLASIEGNALEGKYRIADALFSISLALFGKVYDSNLVEVIPPGKTQSITLKLEGYNKKLYTKRRAKRMSTEAFLPYELVFMQHDSTAILRISTFAPPLARKYKNFIARSFKAIQKKNCTNLIIDIRDNGGGSSGWVEYLYSFLDTAGYNTPNNIIARNSEIALQRARLFNRGITRILTRYFFKKDEDVQSFRSWTTLPIGAYDTIYFHEPTVQKKSLVYTGKCYLLINGLTASAGVDFTNQFKRTQRGPVIGEPCLGPISGTFGNPAAYKLPNSHLSLFIATIRYNNDRTFQYIKDPIQPDFTVLSTPEDIAKRKDTQLEFVKSLIQQP